MKIQATQPLHRMAIAMPDSLAVENGAQQRSWGEFVERVARLAGGLCQLDVQPGDRVGILALNSDRYLEFYYAVWWAGAAVVPMNVRWSPAENAYSLNDSGTRVLFVDSAFAGQVPAILKEAEKVETVVFVDDADPPAGMRRYEELLASAEPIDDRCGAGEDMAGIFYTGGTTGHPKGVVLSHRSLWFNGLAMSNMLRIEPDSRVLHIAPMFHLAGQATCNAGTMVGATHGFVPAFEPRQVIEAVQSFAPTHLLMVPTMISMLLSHPEFAPAKFASVRYLIYGASPMPEGLLSELMEKLPHVALYHGYGQTEMGPSIAIMPPEFHTLEGPRSGKLRSAGRPAYGVTVRIADSNGKTVPKGTVGQVVARSPGVMSGYWNRPKETEETLKDGEILTGDAAYMDEDGFVFIVDRIKDMIISGGENVYSAEVESVLSRHPAVATAAVIGIPSDQWGEAVHAIVILKEGVTATPEEIREFCKASIAGYKVPRSIEFRSEPFPLSGAGKVLKRDLRAPYWKGQQRAVN